MFNLLLSSFLTVFFHFCSGTLILKFLKIKIKQTYYFYSLISLLGIVFLSFIGLFSNFFFKLDVYFNTIIFILIVFVFFLTQKKLIRELYNNFNFIYFLFFCSFGMSLLLVFSNSYRPDAGLYHLPYISILNENKIIFGISNLHQRFGHTSILQYLSALHYNYFFGVNGIVLPSASIAIYTISNLIFNFKDINKITVSKLFALLILVYICFKMNRYSEYGNDAPAHFIFFIIISLYLNFKENLYKFKKIDIFYLTLIFSIFAFANKTFLVVALFVPFLLIKNIFLKISKVRISLIFIFLISWLLKNIFTTGCIIYPMPATCLVFEWTNFVYSSNVFEVSTGSEAWAKDWSNQKVDVLDYNEYLKNFYWIKFWFKNQFIKILGIIIPYLFIILIIILYFYLSSPKKKLLIKNKNLQKKYFSILLITLIGVIIWFLKGPIYRYGYSYIIVFLSLSFSLLIFKYFNKYEKKKLYKFTNLIICLSILVLTVKQSVRIYDKFNFSYENYPWPKFYSFNEKNNKIESDIIKRNGEIFYFKSKGTYCFYSKSPCSSENVDKNLKLKKKFNYKIYYF